MSVINKMLRDLDRRQGRMPGAPAVGSAPLSPLHADLRDGIRGDNRAGNGSPGFAGLLTQWWFWVGVVLVVLAGAGWWMQQRGDLPELALKVSVTSTKTTPAPSVAVPMAAASGPAESPTPSAAAPAASAPAVADLPAVAATTPLAAAATVSSGSPAAAAPSVSPPTAIVPPGAAPAKPLTPPQERVSAQTGLKMETTLALRKAVVSTSTSTNPNAAVPSASASQSLPEPRPPASQEALLRAQALWNAGSREAAMDWLQEAIGVAERSPVAANAPAGNPVLLPLVREQARMMLAEGRYTALWELLTRLEPQLGTAPDLWAIRANAAQRLGRHQDSVHAYMMALQARPDEQRWMLGAAVSLAALGQTTSAADMAERARAMGVVSKDVLAYLRQMGVPLK